LFSQDFLESVWSFFGTAAPSGEHREPGVVAVLGFGLARPVVSSARLMDDALRTAADQGLGSLLERASGSNLTFGTLFWQRQ
jgi:hypothetical protein